MPIKRDRPRRPRKRKRRQPRKRRKSIVTKNLEKLVRDSERRWSSKRPKTKKERNDLLQTCGRMCFLDAGMTGTNDYAICDKCSRNECYCYPNCDGLLNVKRIANKRELPFIEHTAQYLADELECEWTEAVKIILLNKYPDSLNLI